MPVVRTVARDAGNKNYRFSELVLGIVKSPPFQMKVKSQPEPGPALARVGEPQP
jgi:hypothetical protein